MARIYTYRSCTIEVAKGGRTAKANVPGGPTRSFTFSGRGATAQVQAEQWVKSLWRASLAGKEQPVEEPTELEDDNG